MRDNRLTKLMAALVMAGISASAITANATTQNTLNAPRSAKIAQKNVRPDAQNRMLYIVRLKEPSVAIQMRASASGIVAPGTASSAANNASTSSVGSGGSANAGNAKLDVRSPQAVSYTAHLDSQQKLVISAASAAIHRLVVAERQYHYALNGFAVRLTAQEADAMRKIAGVKAVGVSGNSELKTNLSMPLIGAPLVWNDPSPVGNRGAGAVVGMLDTGINFNSPAFFGTENQQFFPWFPLGSPSFVFTNPLGEGNYFGWCNPGFYPNDATGHDPCNDKVIGSWDYVNAVAAQDPNAVGDNPGATDQDNHGSHTSSTSVGNSRGAIYQGGAYLLSGVAPHANLVISQVCYDINEAGGVVGSTCPDVGSVDAIEEAISEGIVDVLSYSIGPTGGDSDSPWDDDVEMAFLSAVDAGIFVSAAGGNDGPTPSTLSNQAPWIATVAATTTSRQAFGKQLAVTGPGKPPADVSQIFAAYSTGSGPFTAGFSGSTPLNVSAGYGTADDGCSAYASGTFAHSIAVIERGTCTFATKQKNAADAGAAAVLIANNRAGAIGGMSGLSATSIPVFGILEADGDALAAFAATDSNATTASLGTIGVAVPGPADQVASFSSRGPNSEVNVLKPDIGAPGVDILASYSGVASAVGEDSGTSMATPHIGGSAALVHVAHPTWSAPEIKSALMMTAKNAGLQTQAGDGSVSDSTPNDVGSGRVQVDQAVNAGLVLDEHGFTFLAADPEVGGDPRTLNLASLYDQNCAGSCSFTRSFKGTSATPQQWSVAAEVDGIAGVMAMPSTFTALPKSGTPVAFSIDTSSVTTPGWFFGEVTLTPADNSASPVLHLPVAVNVAPQQIVVSSDPIVGEAAAGSKTTGTLTVSNNGGVPLNVEVQNSGTSQVEPVAQDGNNNNGYASDQFLGDATDIYNADDATLYGSHELDFVQIDGFTLPNIQQVGTANSITFKVYADANGVPAGNPDATDTSGEIYSCTRTTDPTDPNSTGLGIGGRFDTVLLDLGAASAAGCPALPILSGKYWVVAYPTFAGDSSGLTWYRQQSITGSGSTPVEISPSSGDTSWSGLTDNSGNPLNGLAMDLFTTATCGADWLSVTPSSGTIGALGTGMGTVTFDATHLTPGTYTANICLNSDDPSNPSLVAPVVFKVQ